MRVLFVSWRDLANPSAGGSEIVVDRLLQGLAAHGHDVALLCGGPVAARPYPVRDTGGRFSQYLRAPFAYLRHHRDADLLVEVVNGMPFFAPLWRRRARVCVLFHVHAEQWFQYFPRPVAAVCAWLERTGLRVLYRRTPVITISGSTADDLVALGLPRSGVHVIDLGADDEPTSGTPAAAPASAVSAVPVSGAAPGAAPARSSEPRFVVLGRLAPNKRLDLLLDHWAAVQPRVGGTLVFVGDGPERSALEARVAGRGQAGVVFEGRVDDARKTEVLSQAWLLVHTAEREGWGLALVEAAACGTPALAYRVHGVRDAVVDGTTGVLVDSDEAFVREWVRLAGDPGELARLGAAARDHAAAFTWARTVEQFESIVEPRPTQALGAA